MNVNFAITTPPEWVKNALNFRNESIINPNSGKNWSVRRIPWARLISGVLVNSDSSYRLNNVLWCGDYNAGGTSYSRLSTFANSYNSINFRPRAGLQSLTVAFKGTMGSTRSCTVNFQCWTLEELQEMERLYMVPGMSLIAEWGWSLTPSGAPCLPNDNFLNLEPVRDPYASVMKEVINRRETNEGCYDGLIGMITNFNYSLNEQLGFDCEVELVSPGEMWLEQNATTTSKNCSSNENGEQKIHSNLEYVFHDLYHNNKTEDDCNETNNTQGDLVCVMQEWETETREYDKKLRTGIGEQFVDKATSLFGGSATTHQEVYISWAYFVKLVNDNINLFRDGDDPSKSEARRHENPPNLYLALDLIPVTILPKFYSLDPTICTFKPSNIDIDRGKQREIAIAILGDNTEKVQSENSAAGDGKSSEVEPESSIWESFKQGFEDLWQSTVATIEQRVNAAIENDSEIRKSFPDALPKLDDLEFAKKQINNTKLSYSFDKVSLTSDNSNFVLKDHVGLLNNIFLNAGYLRDLVVDVAGDSLTIQDFMSKVLNDLNIATGNLWNLQWFIPEEDSHRVHIYDSNYANATAEQAIPYEFSIVGNNKTILLRNATVESKLVDGFKEMVLYGNNAKDNGNNDNANQGTKLYAENITDGWRLSTPEDPEKHGEKCKDSKGEETKSSLTPDPSADLDYAYVLLLRAADPETVTSAKNAMQQYVNWINTKNPAISKVLPRNNNILLPFNFSIKLDGFSGFSWGNVISFDYLPKRYGNKIFFQITKIGHEVDGTDWTTNIETVMRVRNTE